MANTNLPHGFVSVEEAIKLIESDTRKEPVVDVLFMVNNLPYLRVNGNFNIKLLTKKDGKIVDNGSRFVQIESDFQRITLEHALTEHYKQATGKEIDPGQIGLSSITAAYDDNGGSTVQPRLNDKPMTKFGDPTIGGTQDVKE